LRIRIVKNYNNNKNRINELEERKDKAQFQRKITTQLLTAIEYGMEIDAISVLANEH
jgi:hypothetical protein